MAEDIICETTISLHNEFGLHARPAGRIAKAAQQFEANIMIAFNGREVDAKSILDILSLAAPSGSALRIQARGDDARYAVEHLESIFRDNLGEDR
ncbi:HPr family phosphocarrier protein [Desulfonatronospira sp.]|uniref:HPr family phosphocarrier protein n=1 Tax=Desulfonatronospira sp. TaxID=1962951 RepID=UPI0025C213A2|nr:HPr family phosphocarrier protein [Desulfonatronospira sp.]